MNITWRNSEKNNLDSVELSRLHKVMQLLKLNEAIGIDSYTMTPAGPIISSVFLVCNNLLIEVKLTTKNIEFDIASIKQIINYRVKFGTVEDKENKEVLDEEIKAALHSDAAVQSEGIKNTPTMNFIEVVFTHTDRLISALSYFGEDAEDWLEFILRTYPKESLLNL